MKCVGHYGFEDNTVDHVLCCIKGGTNTVTCSLDLNPVQYGSPTTYTWEMYLQRKVNGKWTVIGSKKSGYVSQSSPSSRTFTGIGKHGTPVRTVIYYSVPKPKGVYRMYTKYSKEITM